MRRILLAIEDFNELLFCESVLKKTGFDTQSFQTDLAISGGILSFNPELLILTAGGSRVNGINYLSKLKSKGKNLPVILIGSRSRLNMSDKQIIALIEPPLSPRVLIEVIASHFGLDEDALSAKYEKTSEYKDVKDNSSQFIKGKGSVNSSGTENVREGNVANGGSTEGSLDLFKEKNKESSEVLKARGDRYKKIATATPLPKFLGFPKEAVQDQVKFFRQDENTEKIRLIDEERRMFAIELARRFKKK